MSKKDFHGNREALANLRKEVDNLYRKFKEALKIAGANHPIVHTVCRKLKGVMTREESLLGRMQSRLSELSEQRRRQVEVKLIAAFIEAAEANATTLVEFEQARVFASYMASLEDDVEYGEDALVRSTASLIAERIADTGNNLKSMWVQQPLHLRIDAAVRPATAGAAAYGMQIGASEASYFSQLPPSNRELLRLFAATGALAARARNEVVQLIKRKVESDEAFLQKILMGVNLVALGLVPFTEGVSLAVAGAIDAAFALREAKIALNQYTTQSDLAKIALTAVEDMYWKVPHLTDLTEKLVTLTLQIFGDVITTGAASHLIDALSIAYTIAS